MLTTPTPDRTHRPHTTTAEPDLETRMAVTEAAMTVRMVDQAAHIAHARSL
ncbi:hypothetical protein [Streptomyces mordarskii]|uniref:Uncharacterized protein n=1 Tax=Streptomyces mordarskii TaxID=1226758 RepID=A0ABN1EUY1_9ACTN